MPKNQAPALEEPTTAELRERPAQDDGLKTPEEWAAETGNVRALRPNFVIDGNKEREAFTPEHLAAEQFHAWKVHWLHTATPLRISREDYLAALGAAGACQSPHRAACSPYHPNLPTQEAK